ncbi:hypothetical protein COHA_003111 [Chlorella ohadii]|uniref:STAS domain-containing protein n=1 Tax=Chlorella ohadii TaxID=2649997 RepID=A0AAD5DVQ1_9CHLO|nr:hypothetical protein COHA_003111 [Chlorella ohadii]
MFAGLVDCTIALPLQTSFAAIIFRDPYFHPLLGSLVKLVFLSSALHQLTVVACSSMPYAVGQVQDVGLIFLSAIASAVVQQCSAAGVTPENTTATVLTAVTAATGVVGILLVCTGVLKLARLVQYVPLPVMGGYLCFVGYFVLGSGVSLATGLQVGSGLQSWAQLANTDALLKLAPALVLVALISLVMARTRSPFALPTLLVAAPAAFYAVLFATGHSLEDAREAGWVGKPQPGDSEWRFWRAWALYNIHDFPPSNIYWAALPGQLYKLLTLFFIVAFGSSMDIAAIQADASHELDFNSELMNIGVSNLATAAAGVGFTGSYIFSQSLFMRRMGVESRVMGVTLAGKNKGTVTFTNGCRLMPLRSRRPCSHPWPAAVFLAMFAAPANLLAFLPKFYFGGLTAWIGQDILKDWLLLASRRVSAVEYALLLTTFALVMGAGLEVGIGVGILLAALHFAYSYSRVTLTAFTVVPSRSGAAVRTFDQRTVLNLFADRITAVSLTGYVFFGSSLNVMETVMAIARSTLSSQPHTPAAPVPATQPVAVGEQWGAGSEGQHGQAARSASLRSMPSSGALRRTHETAQQVLDSARQAPGAAAEGAAPSCDARQGQLAAALADSPRFLILDFRRVQGLDATAARSFVALHNRLQHMGIQLIVTHLPARHAATNVRARLAAQGLVLHQPQSLASSCAEQLDEPDSGVPWFSTMDAACQYCEEHFLSAAVAHGLCPPPARRMTLAQVLQANLELPRCVLGDVLDYQMAAALLQRFTSKEELRAGQTLFTVGSPADDIWLLESGCITCCVNFAAGAASSPAHLAGLPPHLQPALPKRVVKYGVGSIVGDLDFFLQRPRRRDCAACPGLLLLLLLLLLLALPGGRDAVA